jgi:glutamine amidotransferase-like uncharacterized protein
MIRRIIVYNGHLLCPENGPYFSYIQRRIDMFTGLNAHRERLNRPPWKVERVSGEELIDKMKGLNPKETLFVMPAGESSKFDKSFSESQIAFLLNFFKSGGKGYFTCGAAYWASRHRIYHGICPSQLELGKTVDKISRIPLFSGIAEGPLCPFPGKKFKAGFYSDAVKVTDGSKECTIFLSGGGSFIPDDQTEVLARYPHSELKRLGKPEEEFPKLENAAVLETVGKGAVLLSMFHPYYGANDIDVEAYEEAFAGSGTNWREVHSKLSSEEVRMEFVNDMLMKLEDKGAQVSTPL